jgi:hypothetical protein
LNEKLKWAAEFASSLIEKIQTINNIQTKKKTEFKGLGEQIRSQIQSLEGTNSNPIKRFLENAIDFLRFVFGFDFKQNKQMKFQANFNKMINLYNESVPQKEKFLVSINCKSGKDRTGVLQTIFTFNSLVDNFKQEVHLIKAKDHRLESWVVKSNKKQFFS